MNDINELIKKAKKGNKTAEHQLHKDFYEIYLSFLKKYEILGASPDNELFNILFEQTLDDSNNISIMKEKFNQVVKMFLNNQYLAQFQKNESAFLARYFNGFLTSELTIDAFLIKLKALADFEEVTGYEISFATLMDTFNKTSKLDEYLEQCIKTRDNVILKKIVMGFTTKVEKDFLEVYCLRHDLSLEEETKDENECYYSDDSIKMYLQEIGEIPLLTKEEEYDLGMRAMKGDKVAIDSLVTHNLRFVVAVSKHYYNKGLPFLDIIQDGNCGLLKAATKFDPTKGFRFTTYAFNWINRFIVRGITNKSDIIRKPVGVSLVLNKIALFSDKYVEQNNRQPSVKEIATEFDMSIEAAQSLVEIVQTVNKVVSLNIFINDGETGELQDLIADTTGSLENDLFDTEEKEEIVSFLNDSKLTEREKDIINKRFGLSNEVPMNTVQIAKIYGITRERIRQIEQSALKKLRKDPYINNLYIYISNHDIKLSGMERANINEKEVAIVSQQKLLEKSKKDQRFKGLYERIPEEKREDFESALALLPSEYLAILHQKFGEDFSENKVFACNNEISLCINKTILPLIKRTMKKKEQGEEPKKKDLLPKKKVYMNALMVLKEKKLIEY